VYVSSCTASLLPLVAPHLSYINTTMADVGFRELADAAVLSRAANVSTAPLANTTASWTSAKGMLSIAKRVMTFPGRLVERLRLLDELLQEDPYEQAEAIAAASREGRVVDTPLRRPNAVMNRNAGGVHAGAGSTSRQMQAATMPGPWGFFVSGYAAGVIILVCAHLICLNQSLMVNV
jgi:hypothetical protein